MSKNEEGADGKVKVTVKGLSMQLKKPKYHCSKHVILNMNLSYLRTKQ